MLIDTCWQRESILVKKLVQSSLNSVLSQQTHRTIMSVFLGHEKKQNVIQC